jgi:hypothetical protein
MTRYQSSYGQKVLHDTYNSSASVPEHAEAGLPSRPS